MYSAEMQVRFSRPKGDAANNQGLLRPLSLPCSFAGSLEPGFKIGLKKSRPVSEFSIAWAEFLPWRTLGRQNFSLDRRSRILWCDARPLMARFLARYRLQRIAFETTTFWQT